MSYCRVLRNFMKARFIILLAGFALGCVAGRTNGAVPRPSWPSGQPTKTREFAIESQAATCASFRPHRIALASYDGPVRLPSITDDFPAFRNQAPNARDFDAEVNFTIPQRVPPVEVPKVEFTQVLSEQWSGVCRDHAEFYTRENMAWLAAGLSVGAVLANTGFDENFVRHEYAETFIFVGSDEFAEAFHEPKFFGEGYYMLPILAAAAFSEPLFGDLPAGQRTAEWGQRSLRTVLVGAPPMLALQVITGGSRPGESPRDSHWEPFADNNGVSGHSFMGAIPFLTAAKMTDRFWVKGVCYTASALPALSRVNDDDHYFSQALLGWWMAYLAANAVDRSYGATENFHVYSYPQANGAVVGVEFFR